MSEILTGSGCKAKRITHRLSVLELSRLAGVSHETIKSFEKDSPGTRMGTIRKLEAAFKKLSAPEKPESK